MLDLEEINNTIKELENGDTTFDTCIKLASLYIVQERINSTLSKTITTLSTEKNDAVQKELSDIIPSYSKYCTAKKSWKLGNVDENQVLQTLKFMCVEIREFIQTLYSSTDTEKERLYIVETLSTVFDNL